MRSGLEHDYIKATEAYTPRRREGQRAPRVWYELNVATALATIGGTTACCATLGALLGAMMSLWIPGYFEAMFGVAKDDSTFQPLSVGLGLGLTQGIISGIVIGCVVVLSVAIYSRR